MAEKSPAEGGVLSAEQLLTGIGKLIYSLNESVLGISGRLERLETAMTSILEERLGGIASLMEQSEGRKGSGTEPADLSVLGEKLEVLALLMEQSNEHLAELVGKASVQPAYEPPDLGSLQEALTVRMAGVAALVERSNEHLAELVEKASVPAAEPLDLGNLQETLSERMTFVAMLVEQTNAHLAALAEASGRPAEAPVLPEPLDLTPVIEAIVSSVGALGPEITASLAESGSGTQSVLEGIREKLASLDGILINLHEAMKGLAEPRPGAADSDALRPELDRLGAGLSESVALLGATLSEVVERSDGNRAVLLEEKLAPVVEGLSGLHEGIESLRGAVADVLSGIRTETVGRVETLSGAVEKGMADQTAELGRMTELLTVHASEVSATRAGELNRRAIGFYNSGDFESAGNLLREALETHPGSPELHANLAHVEAASGRIAEAEASFRKALESDPGLEPAVSGLGALMVLGGRPDDGIEFLSGFLARGGEQSPGVMLALARAYAAGGRHRDAVSLLETALQAAPGHPGIEAELAQYREDKTPE